MTTPNQFPPQPSPENRLTDLLTLTAENFTPQQGYRLSLDDVDLRHLDQQHDYRPIVERWLGVAVLPEASFVYTYSPGTDGVGLTAIRFGLETKLLDKATGEVTADCVYLQKYEGSAEEEAGFVQTYGLKGETIAETDKGAVGWPMEPWQRLLEPLGLYHLGGGDELLRTLAGKLDLSEHWSVREQQVVPLSPKEDDLQYQMLIVRKRSIAAEAPKMYDDSRLGDSEAPAATAYGDEYEVTFQTIERSEFDERARHIDEVTLSVLESFVDARAYRLTETEYIRYQDPFIIGDAEVTPITSIVSEPTPEDFEAFVRLLEDSYSS